MPYTAAEKAERYQSVHDKLASAVVELQDIANNSEPDSEENQSAQSLASQLTNMVWRSFSKDHASETNGSSDGCDGCDGCDGSRTIGRVRLIVQRSPNQGC